MNKSGTMQKCARKAHYKPLADFIKANGGKSKECYECREDCRLKKKASAGKRAEQQALKKVAREQQSYDINAPMPKLCHCTLREPTFSRYPDGSWMKACDKCHENRDNARTRNIKNGKCEKCGHAKERKEFTRLCADGKMQLFQVCNECSAIESERRYVAGQKKTQESWDIKLKKLARQGGCAGPGRGIACPHDLEPLKAKHGDIFHGDHMDRRTKQGNPSDFRNDAVKYEQEMNNNVVVRCNMCDRIKTAWNDDTIPLHKKKASKPSVFSEQRSNEKLELFLEQNGCCGIPGGVPCQSNVGGYIEAGVPWRILRQAFDQDHDTDRKTCNMAHQRSKKLRDEEEPFTKFMCAICHRIKTRSNWDFGPLVFRPTARARNAKYKTRAAARQKED